MRPSHYPFMRRPAAILTALLLAACGGSGGGGSSSARPPKPADVAGKIGCSGYADDTTQEIYVQAVGKCSIGSDDSVRVLTFNDNTGRDAFVKIAKGFGGNYAVGDRFAIEGSSSSIDVVDGKDGAHRV